MTSCCLIDKDNDVQLSLLLFSARSDQYETFTCCLEGNKDRKKNILAVDLLLSVRQRL